MKFVALILGAFLLNGVAEAKERPNLTKVSSGAPLGSDSEHGLRAQHSHAEVAAEKAVSESSGGLAASGADSVVEK
jgi:hypothetical protein